MKLSIIVPAYNEEGRIRPFLDAYARHFFGRCGDDVEFVVVVNHSTDRTAAIAESFRWEGRALRVIVDPADIGKGAALMKGFAAARGALVGFVDADGATPPEAFQDLVDGIGSAGAIIASRWLPGSRITPPPWSRRVASRAFNGLVRRLFRLRITDTQCGAKLLTRDAVRAVLPKLGTTRWAFDVDLLFQLRRAGFSIKEVPTVWNDQPGSRLRVGRAAFEMFAAVIRLRLLFSSFRWIVSVYDHTLGRVVRLSR